MTLPIDTGAEAEVVRFIASDALEIITELRTMLRIPKGVLLTETVRQMIESVRDVQDYSCAHDDGYVRVASEVWDRFQAAFELATAEKPAWPG
jgi:hypothetical protein